SLSQNFTSVFLRQNNQSKFINLTIAIGSNKVTDIHAVELAQVVRQVAHRSHPIIIATNTSQEGNAIGVNLGKNPVQGLIPNVLIAAQAGSGLQGDGALTVLQRLIIFNGNS